MNVFSELKRRNVFRVGIAYLVFGWLVLQIADIAFPALGLPEWTITLIIVLLAIGFIPALLFSWAYELTPEGLKRESDIARSQSITPETGRKLNLVTIAMLVLVLAVIVVDRMLLDGQKDDRGDAAAHEYSIAVLAFEDLSDTQDQEYFGDGLAEELLNQLAKVEDFRVAGRTSSFAFKGRDDDLRVIGEKLNVATILEGSVRKAGDQLRITAQLNDVADGYHLWSETYDGNLENIFEFQEQIARSVVTALKSTLLDTTEPVTLEPQAVADTRAYDLYLQGRYQLWKRRPDPLRQAEELFEQAIAIDPDYAPAYASLATALYFQARNSDVDVTVVHAQAEAALDRALAIDPGNAEALASLGLLRGLQGRIDEARDALERAIIRNPNHAQAHTWLGNQVYSLADPVRGFELTRKAYAIDPDARVVLGHMSFNLWRFGRVDQAIAMAREMHSMYPEDTWAYRRVGQIRVTSGQQDLTLKINYRAYLTAPDWTWGFSDAAWTLINLGEYELADVWVSAIEQISPEANALLNQRAQLAFVRGRPEEAVRLYAKAAERRADPASIFNLGWGHMVARDFVSARKAMELSLSEPGRGIPRFDPYRWPQFIDYARVLQETGEPERAAELIVDIKKILEAQVAQGVVFTPGFPYNNQAMLASLYAMSGDTEQAMTALRRAALMGGLYCIWCVRNWPYFDNLSDEPSFTALISEQEAGLAAQRQRLGDEGMLLTPEQLLQLESFTYDPFLD